MIRDTVLVADDDPDFRELMRFVIEAQERAVVEATDFTQAVAVASIERDRLALVLLDYLMPGDRIAAVDALRALVPSDGIVLCTACTDARRLAAELGLSRYLPKPVDLRALEIVVDRVCRAA